jgi:hypothetical protein
MTVFNRSIYKYLSTDIAKKQFYEKMIKRCHRNPQIDIKINGDYTEIHTTSAADRDFYLMMNPIEHNKIENYNQKYAENIEIIKNFATNMENYHYDLAITKIFNVVFDNDDDIFECIKNIPSIHKYFEYTEDDNTVFIFGHEYMAHGEYIDSKIFTVSRTGISNYALTPKFDIDEGFILYNIESEVQNYMNIKYYEWLKNDCRGNIF